MRELWRGDGSHGEEEEAPGQGLRGVSGARSGAAGVFVLRLSPRLLLEGSAGLFETVVADGLRRLPLAAARRAPGVCRVFRRPRVALLRRHGRLRIASAQARFSCRDTRNTGRLLILLMDTLSSETNKQTIIII